MIEPTVRISRWLRYGIGSGVVGLLFVGIILGPVAIYFGLRARKACSLASDRRKGTAGFVIALGAFDIFFSLIQIVGMIRILGGAE